MYLCRISFHCFCVKWRYTIIESSGGDVREEAWTYPAIPIIPKVGHGDVKANTESEGSNKDGGHVDTYEGEEAKARK